MLTPSPLQSTCSFTTPKRVAADGYSPIIQCRPTEHQLAFLRCSDPSLSLSFSQKYNGASTPSDHTKFEFEIDSDYETDSDCESDCETVPTNRSNLVVRNFTDSGATTITGIVVDQLEPWEYIAASTYGSNSFVYAIDGNATDSVDSGVEYTRKRLVWVGSAQSNNSGKLDVEPSFEHLFNPKGRIVGMDFVNGNLFVYIWNKAEEKLYFYCRSESNGETCPVRIQTISGVQSRPIVKSVENTFVFIIGWDQKKKLKEIERPIWAFWRPTHVYTDSAVALRVFSFTSGLVESIKIEGASGIHSIVKIDANGKYAIATTTPEACRIDCISVGSDHSATPLLETTGPTVLKTFEIPDCSAVGGSVIYPHPSGQGFVLCETRQPSEKQTVLCVRVFNHLGYETMDPIEIPDVAEFSMTNSYLCYGTNADPHGLYITKLDLNPDHYTL